MNPKLNPTAQMVLAATATAAEAVQLNVTMSAQVHAGISMFLVIAVGLGVKTTVGNVIRKALTPEIVTAISGLLGALLVAQQSFSMGRVGHTVIGVAVVVAAAFGVAPATTVP